MDIRNITPGQRARLDQEMAGVDETIDSLVTQWSQICPDAEREERLSLFMNAAMIQLQPNSIAALLAAAVQRLADILPMVDELEKMLDELEKRNTEQKGKS